jgi:hypothetical protein
MFPLFLGVQTISSPAKLFLKVRWGRRMIIGFYPGSQASTILLFHRLVESSVVTGSNQLQNATLLRFAFDALRNYAADKQVLLLLVDFPRYCLKSNLRSSST